VGKRFLRTIVQEPTVLAATGEIAQVDLPVNPLSFLVLTLLGEQPDASVTDVFRYLTDYYAAIDNVRIVHKGENIIQGNLQDLTMLSALLMNYTPWGTHPTGAIANRGMSFLLPLGRKPYWSQECFPATSRGNLRFGFNVLDITPGTFTAVSWMLEALELIEAQPTSYIKCTTSSRAIAATGRQRVPLPLGNEIIGVILNDPSTEISTTETFAWGKVKVMVDNVEQYYAESNWESLRADVAMRCPGIMTRLGHEHAGAAADTNVGEEMKPRNEPPLQYGYLDFDPHRDDEFLLDTNGHSDVELDLNSDVSTGTARYLPIELIRLGARP